MEMPAMPKSLRLTFAYEGDDVRLVSRQEVDAIPPASDDIADGAEGFWIEVRSDQDEPVHRRVMEDPLRSDVEVFSLEPDRSLARASVERLSGSFSVLVPHLPDATEVALFSSSAPGAQQLRAALGEPHTGAVEVARFSLRGD